MAENYYGISDTGRVRDNNEDTFIAEKVLNNEYILVCVIDGVGGYDGGEVAAAIAREAVLNHFKKLSGDVISMMKDALVAVNENIHTEKQQNKEKNQMACVLTLALVNVENNKFFYAHVGDTRLYLLRDHSLVKITKDHSFVGFLEDSGRLTEAQAMKHPKRNEINKALGFDQQIGITGDYIETGESPFLPGDIILLCSDGLTDMISNSEITAILVDNKTIEEKGKELVDAANNKGGKDNITVALVHHDAARVEQEATRPVSIVKKKDEAEIEVINGKNETTGTHVSKASQATGSKKGLVTILAVVCFILLAVLIWSLFKNSNKANAVIQPQEIAPINNVATEERNDQEKKLLDSINSRKSIALILSDSIYGQSITVTDSLFIQKDSLYLKGGLNSIISADSSYKGPGIVLSSNCKWIFLDSLTLENFDVGILLSNNALHLRNVKFKHCRIPVEYQFALQNDVYISGGIKDTALFRIESLPK
jgi:serine/threonine protein phosphatase PrpC/regulator of extracellular matrix RemA (YlzA/DUF370 family)